MGLGFSKNVGDISNYSGGSENILNNVQDIKNVENKLVEFLNSTGFISSGVQDFDTHINQISNDTNPSNKHFNTSGNDDAITNIKDYLNDGLNIKGVSNYSNDDVLNTSYGLLNNINKSSLNFINEDMAMLNYNIKEISNMHNALSNSVNILSESSNLNSNVMNLLNKTTDMLEQQQNYMTIIKNSDDIASLQSKFNIIVASNDTPLDQNILAYMNNVANTAANLHNYRNIRKLYNDDKINLNSSTIRQMKSLTDNLSSDMSFDNVSNYVTKLYDAIDNNKNNMKYGGGRNLLLKNKLLLNKSWDSSDTVKNIFANSKIHSYTGGNIVSDLKPLNFTTNATSPSNNYDGGDTLHNKLRNTLHFSNAARNQDIIKNANILSEKLNGLSTDLLSVTSDLKKMDIVQLNDLEKIFKKFLYFTSFNHKNMYLILLDYFIDMQSTFIKQDFILKINNLISLMEKGSSISSKLNGIGSKLSDVINFINKASSEFQSKHGLTKGSMADMNNDPGYVAHDSSRDSQSNRTPLDAYDNKIVIDYDDIPDLSVVNTVISKSVFRLLYSIRLQTYFKQLSETTNNHSKEYEELVGKSIGAEIDKIKQDYTLIMNKLNEFEHNGSAVEFKEDKSLELNFPLTVIPVPINIGENDTKYEYIEIKKIFMYLPTTPPIDEKNSNIRDHRAWGRNDLTWVDDETLRGISLQNTPISGENLRNMIANYKEFFTNYYESIIGLYMATQAIDIYLMQFTEKIKKTPEMIEKLDSLLSKSKIASMIHSDKSIDKLINVFDPNDYHNVDLNNEHISDINQWANINTQYSHIHFATDDARNHDNHKRINPLLFHQYFDQKTEPQEVTFTQNNTKYNDYVDHDNNVLFDNDMHFRKSSILKCGAGACDELRPMIDLIMNRISDNSLNRGGLHNRHWSSVPGKLNMLGDMIYNNSNVGNIVKSDIKEEINHAADEKKMHSLGSEYFEKFKVQSNNNKKPSAKMKELKEFHKNNTTLANILSLFFSMLGIDENSNTILSPKTIMEYLLNFMSWGSYTLTNVPSTVDINIGNGLPLSNDDDKLSKLVVNDINFNTNDKQIGLSIYSYFVSTDISNVPFEKQYDFLFDFNDNTNINHVHELSIFNNTRGGAKNTDDGFAVPDRARDIKPSNNQTDHFANPGLKTLPFVTANIGDEIQLFSGKHMNNITLNKLIKGLSLMKRNIPRGLTYRLNNKQSFNRLDKDMFKVNDVTRNFDVLANANNPLFVGINDNLSVFNKDYTAMNIFDTNVRVTLIHSNQLVDTPGSKYGNTLQFKSQNLFSNVMKSVVGKILTVIGLYDLNDFKNNKPWRTYIMDTTRLTLGGADMPNETVVRSDIADYYIRIPLLLKFYKTIFYDISQSDTNIKNKLTNSKNESVKILPEFDYPFDALIKHYFMFSSDNNSTDMVTNTTFNKNLYRNINKVYDFFSKQSRPNLLTYVAQQLVKEINQKYGLLFENDLTMYKTRIAKFFGVDNDYITSLYDAPSTMLDGENLLINTNENPSNLPSQKYTTVKNAYKNDKVTSFTNFSAKSYYENIFDFRKFIQSILTDSINDKQFSEKYNLYSSFFDIDEYMNEIKNEFKNNTTMTDDEKVLFLSTATHSQKTSISHSESNKKQLMFDFIITPLKQIDNLLNYLAHVRALFSNEVFNNTSTHSINKPYHWDSTQQSSSNFTLKSDVQLLYNLSSSSNNNLNNYVHSALYGFIPKLPNDNDAKNITANFVPFNEMLVSHPLNHEYNYKYAFTPYDTVTKTGSVYSIRDTDQAGIPPYNINIDIDNINTLHKMPLPYNLPPGATAEAAVTAAAVTAAAVTAAAAPAPPPPAAAPPPDWLRNDYAINNPTYNKGKGNGFIINDVLYLDSQYHNNLPVYAEPATDPKTNPSYGLMAYFGADVVTSGYLIHQRQNNACSGRRAANGILLGENGSFNNNQVNHYPPDWSGIKTTNFRLIGSWCPEDLAPNRLGIHEYPYIRPGHLQNRAYNSTYSSAEYLITKLLKNCDLFDINSTPTIQSTFNVSGNVSISFNKVDTLIKEQLFNLTHVLNEFKSYVLSEYTYPCEFYLRVITSQYNDMFMHGVKQDNNVGDKITIYDIQGRLNRFLSGQLTMQDITKNAKNQDIIVEENELFLDPCVTNANNNPKLKLESYNNKNLLITLNKMGARLITKLINPLVFNNKNSEAYVYNPKRLAYLPHQKLTSPLNTIDDQYYGKLSTEFFSDIQGPSPQSNVHMIKTSDILYSEPNPKYCNFYFTNIVNSVNHIIGTLLRAGSNIRDKKIYGKIIDIFKNHNELLLSTYDNRFDSIDHINYLGDYGRTGHGTFFDKSLPFVLYNKKNPDIIAHLNLEQNPANLLSFMTNYQLANYTPNETKTILKSFHHLSLSSIDGLSSENYLSSFICQPPELSRAVLTQYSYYGPFALPAGPGYQSYGIVSGIHDLDKISLFKDTHEGMYPYNNAEYKDKLIDGYNASYYGLCNMPRNTYKYPWYDIIGKPGHTQPLANICNAYSLDNIINQAHDIGPMRNVPGPPPGPGPPPPDHLFDPVPPHNVLVKLNDARKYFGLVYSYGAVQPSNFIYNDVNKFNLKSVVLQTYMADALKYTPQAQKDGHTTTTTRTSELAAKWLKNINDPLKFFSKLQSFTSDLPNDSYVLAIVSETLHGQYAPHVITNVYNGVRSRSFKGAMLPDAYAADTTYANINIDRSNIAGFNTEQIFAPPYAADVDNLHYLHHDNIADVGFNSNNNPHELQLSHTQYTKDHLRLGQAIAAYNPLTLNWETFQPLQYDMTNKDNKTYSDLEKVQFKNKHKNYTNIFYKMSYAKLLTDLLGIDSSAKLELLNGGNNVLYSLSLASAYSTPRNEYHGSALFEYRPTYLNDINIDSKLYFTPLLNEEILTIQQNANGPDKGAFRTATPYDVVLSLDMGGTGYWEPTGRHPVISSAFQSIASYMVTSDTRSNTIAADRLTRVPGGDYNSISIEPLHTRRYYMNSSMFNINPNGIQNGVLQPINADPSRFGYLIYSDLQNGTYKKYPDAYVPLEHYLEGKSVLNTAERGIKEMAREIHDVIFNKSARHIQQIDRNNMLHLNQPTRDERISTGSMTKAALIAISTCDSRMGPYNMLSAVEDANGMLPKTKTLQTSKKMVTGGAEFVGNTSAQHDIINNASSNILGIALRSSDEPLAISFQDKDKSIENGNILLKTYATVIKNMLLNHTSNPDNKRNMYENFSEISSETKENISAVIPYLLNEVEALLSQIKLLHYYVSINDNLKLNKNVLELNLKHAKKIANVLYIGMDSIKAEFNTKFVFGEQYSGHLKEMTQNASQNTPNVSYAAELYNYLSNCNEAIIRPLGTHNVYYKLNDITSGSSSTFYKRLHAVRKMYDKTNNITCDECPNVNKSINKLNSSLDKFTRKFDKVLIEKIINTCKRIKFTPFEESNVNQFVCLTNNIFTNVIHNTNTDEQHIKASISGFSKYFNVKNESIDNLQIHTELDEHVDNMYKSDYLTPLNSLLFVGNNKTEHGINTICLTLGDDSLQNNDIAFYNSYNDTFDKFVHMIEKHGAPTQHKSNIMKANEYKKSIYDTSSDDHHQLMVFNILDLNILPIDINALSREIPLFYVFNYSASLDEFLSTSMDAYNTEQYNNNVINRRTMTYLTDLNKYLENISPGSKDYYLSSNLQNTNSINLDVSKTLHHNKFSHLNPQLISHIWKDKHYNVTKPNMKIEQIDGFNQMEYLTKFNTVTNLINNIFTATSSHKINSVNNLMDMSIPYKYDYSHYSTAHYYNGVDTDISNIPVDFYKNVTYNSDTMSGSYNYSMYDKDNAVPGQNIRVFVEANKYTNNIDAYKNIMEYVNTKFNITPMIPISTLKDSSYSQKITFDFSAPAINNANTFLGIHAGLKINDIFETIHPAPPGPPGPPVPPGQAEIILNLYKNAKELAATTIYGSRQYIMGYYDNDLIYTHYPNQNYFYKKQHGTVNEVLAEANSETLLHNIYLNSYVKHNQYNCMYNIRESKNKHGILYTNTTKKPIEFSLTTSQSNIINNGQRTYSYEISNPGFETNLCKNWLKLNKDTIENELSIVLHNDTTINKILLDGKSTNKLSPNPCFFNNTLLPNTNTDAESQYELYREMPYTTYYNLSCILSGVDEEHIESITKLKNLENAKFMKKKLDNWIGDGSKYSRAVKNRAMTSWGISDPRSLAFLGDQETLYKKIQFKKMYMDVDKIKRSDDVNDDVDVSKFLVCNRHPMSFDEYSTVLQNPLDKRTLQYKFLLNVNNISSDWYECNKSSKLHTSYKWLRIKPKTLFNHVLPISDTKRINIYNGDINYVNFDTTVHKYSFNNDRNDDMTDVPLFYPKSCPLGVKLIESDHNKHVLKTSHAAVTEGVCASDLHAAEFDNTNIRNIHVLSHIMYSDKTFGYVPLRHLTLLDIGYNFIRYKITQENLYTTQKIISGSLLYDSEYHNESVYEEAYGIKSNESLTKKSSIIPRVKSINNERRPNIDNM